LISNHLLVVRFYQGAPFLGREFDPCCQHHFPPKEATKMALTDGITAAAVKEMRERTGAGMMECRAILVRDNALAAIRDAESVEDLKEVLTAIVNRAFR
jgi:hypothetical protein